MNARRILEGIFTARRWPALALCAALISGTSPVHAQARAALEKTHVQIAIGGKSAMIYLPLTIAERLGYFKDEGLDVEISDFNAGSKALQAVVGGSADAVSGVYEHTIRMQAVNQHLTAFVVMANSMQLAFAVTSAQADKIRTLKDLKGMRIGVSAPGSTTHMMVDRILVSAGLRPQDVSIIGVGLSTTAVAAVQSGQIDAICTAEATASLLEQKGLIKVLVDARTREGTEKVFDGPIPTSVLYAQAAFVRDNPNTAQALTNAIVRAGRWLSKVTPEELAKTVPESFVAGDRTVYLRAFEKVRDGFSVDGQFMARGGTDTLNALAAFDPKIKPAEIDLAETFTNRFAEAAVKLAR